MDTKKLLEILDKNIDQGQLLKDLGKEFVLPIVERELSGIDLIPGTDIDNKIIMEVVNFLKKQLE